MGHVLQYLAQKEAPARPRRSPRFQRAVRLSFMMPSSTTIAWRAVGLLMSLNMLIERHLEDLTIPALIASPGCNEAGFTATRIEQQIVAPDSMVIGIKDGDTFHSQLGSIHRLSVGGSGGRYYPASVRGNFADRPGGTHATGPLLRPPRHRQAWAVPVRSSRENPSRRSLARRAIFSDEAAICRHPPAPGGNDFRAWRRARRGGGRPRAVCRPRPG